jgi:ClpP class serine protease
MPSWNDLLNDLESRGEAGPRWLQDEHQASLRRVGELRGGRNVIFYASAFLQKPFVPANWLQITYEEINGFMSVMFGMDWNKGLTLLLHTPGGITNAAETIVSYLSTKFADIEVIIPTYAMSAGTMISLAADRIVMGKQSQLGPIDPQMPIMGQFVSARAIVDQFERAKLEILENVTTAHAWAPILQSIGPALLQEAQNALAYGETMVARWLEQRMFRGINDGARRAAATAAHFNDASKHKSHGRRIDRNEARQNNVVVEDLEDNQALQEAVLTAYHFTTILFEKGTAAKLLLSDAGRVWVKNFIPAPDSVG